MEENCTSWKTHIVYYAKNIKGIVQILEIWKKIAHLGRHTQCIKQNVRLLHKFLNNGRKLHILEDTLSVLQNILKIWKKIAHIGRHNI